MPLTRIQTDAIKDAITTSNILDGTILPADLSTGRPFWDSSSNASIGTNTPFNVVGSTMTSLTINGSTYGTMYVQANNGAVRATFNATTANNTVNLTALTNHPLTFATNDTERMRLDSAGNLGLGTTSPTFAAGTGLQVKGSGFTSVRVTGGSNTGLDISQTNTTGDGYVYLRDNAPLIFGTNNTERARIDSSGNVFIGKTSRNFGTTGINLQGSGGDCHWTSDSNLLVAFNRLTSDGTLIEFAQANTIEGTISVSGTTVSYNGGHLARYAQTVGAKDESLVKGTVLSNLDEMNVYTDDEGNTVDNEQLNKVKVSDVEGDANVAGVFVNWSHDDAHNVDEINMAMTGDMIIRIAQGTTVARGDLLMSAGNGTAKPQGDDIVRSKTVAKVTSTHVTCTYADGSYCVPCVLMAC